MREHVWVIMDADPRYLCGREPSQAARVVSVNIMRVSARNLRDLEKRPATCRACLRAMRRQLARSPASGKGDDRG